MEIVFEPDPELIEKLEQAQAKETNVIAFPKINTNTAPRSIEELSQNLSEKQKLMAVDVAFKYAQSMAEEMIELGFEFKNPDSAYDFLYLIETLKSMVFRTLDEPHPFHDVVKDLMNIEDPEEIFYNYLYSDEED